ncbi:hypothetical protein [Pseudaestuariivita rosea]|uniref:hypothetical protein n=1 Tax=Pseudaestuariivita rosea TaxID=2763263 RepID=UPI001ABB7A70|nr:hypothetical protein [Pseudaestuariivita rosea]
MGQGDLELARDAMFRAVRLLRAARLRFSPEATFGPGYIGYLRMQDVETPIEELIDTCRKLGEVVSKHATLHQLEATTHRLQPAEQVEKTPLHSATSVRGVMFEEAQKLLLDAADGFQRAETLA